MTDLDSSCPHASEEQINLPLLSGQSDQKQYGTDSKTNGDPKRHNHAAIRYYANDIKEVCRVLKVDPDVGLSEDEVRRRLEKYGENDLEKAEGPNTIKMFFKQFFDFMVIILMLAAAGSLVLRDWIEAGVLFAVVATNVIIGFSQEYKAEKALKALSTLSVPKATVLRGGDREEIVATQLVPGDIVLLEEGDRIPADMRLCEVVNLTVMEAILTGESEAVEKTSETLRVSKKKNLPLGDRKNMGFMATLVTKGRGKGIVCRTGHATEVGKISTSLTSKRAKKTLLQKRLSKLGTVLIVLSIVLCGLVVGIGLLRIWREHHHISKDDLIDMIKVGVSLAVSVIPEGLVAVVSVTMALGVQRMARGNAIVRKLPVVETLGSITVICSDKTGTLTLGKMRTERLWLGEERFNVTDDGFVNEDTSQSFAYKDGPHQLPASLQHALMICSLCNNSIYQKNEDTGEMEGMGDPTEIALTIVAEDAQCSKDVFVHEKNYRFLYEIPFDSDRKMMSVVYGRPEGDGPHGDVIVLTKGATENMLGHCSHVATKGDHLHRMDKKWRQQIEDEADHMSGLGLRVLGLAIKTMNVDPTKTQVSQSHTGSTPENCPLRPKHEEPHHHAHHHQPTVNGEEVEQNLIFLGLVGLMDPPRSEVKGAIEQCKKAGISVSMITGDHPHTAFAIAAQLGILRENEEHRVMRGTELDDMSKEQLSQLQPFPSVFARVSPENKLKIVEALKLRGDVVAMTGDGVNDAPAVKHADCGISMGKTGTDLTIQASDMILTDDNFASIVPAIEEGRRTYDNIQKFVLYLLACNSAEIYVFLIAIAAGLPVPFTPVMILWANLICDVPPAMALGIDPPEKRVLSRKPRNPQTGIFTRATTASVLLFGFSMAAITLVAYVICMKVLHYPVSEDTHDEASNHARGVAFIALCMTQLVHAFLARSVKNTVFRRDILNNRWLIGGVVFSIASLIAACYIPGLQTVLAQWPLNWLDWLIILGCIIAHVALVEFTKLVFRIIASRRKSTKAKSKFYSEV